LEYVKGLIKRPSLSG